MWEATQLNAETRDPPSQDPRDHKEQRPRHDFHPDTLKQTPTKPGRNESGEASTTVLVLLQVVFVVWEIVLVIGAW